MTDNDKNLISLVHYLSYGSFKEKGMSLKEVIRYLDTPIRSKGGKTALECIRIEGLTFLNELKTYMNELESY